MYLHLSVQTGSPLYTKGQCCLQHHLFSIRPPCQTLNVTGCYVSAWLWGARNANVYSRVSAVGAHCSSTRFGPSGHVHAFITLLSRSAPTLQPIRTKASHAHTPVTNQVIAWSSYPITVWHVRMYSCPGSHLSPIWLTNDAILTILVPN